MTSRKRNSLLGTTQHKVFRLLKYYNIEIDTPKKKKIKNAIQINFDKYKDIEDKDEIINSFWQDHREDSLKVERARNAKKKEYEEKKSEYKKYHEEAMAFYKSPEWRKLRYEVLREQGGRCQLCGRSAKDGVVMHVDHIVPLSKDWNKRLDKNNLQVLCEDCNMGKGNTDNIDWRK